MCALLLRKHPLVLGRLNSGRKAGNSVNALPSNRIEIVLSVDSAAKREENGVNEMSLVTVVLTLVVVGVLLWLVNLIPMQSQIKGILNTIVVIAVVIWLLKVFGLFGYITQFRVGH
jgi:hypothetical protein